MADNYREKLQPSNQPYYGQQPPYPHSASAPTEFPTPPPQYSVSEPSFPQPHTTFVPQPPVVIQQHQHVVVHEIPLERRPVNTTCPSCRSIIVTKVKTEPNVATHIVASILCCLCFIPCVCLPYCMSACQSSVHYCPNCAAHIGSYQPGYRYRYRY